MDSDSVITFLLFFAFFILPSIFKQIQARKKKGQKKASANPVNKSSVIGKIRYRIQQFVKELEEQAQKGRQQQTADPGQDFWDSLGKEVPEDQSAYSREPEADPGTGFVEEPDLPPAVEPFTQEPAPPVSRPGMDVSTLMPRKKKKAAFFGQFRRHPLQNAIVWSEILSKPVALRQDFPLKK